MRARTILVTLAAIVSTSLGGPETAVAGDRFALIVSGASGTPEHAEAHERWRMSLATGLRERLGLPADHLVVLSDGPPGAPELATRENVATALRRFRGQMRPDDALLVVLIGHGTFDGADAKFNLVGPDLEAAEWDALLAPMPGRLVIINTTSASFPFLERLSGPNRIVITATDSPAQRYRTVFPEFLGQAFVDEAADIDKNGRLSMWELFMYTSRRVKTWYEQRGQLAVERPLLDDNGDGVGKEAGEQGPDGALASRTFLDGDRLPLRDTDPALAELLGRREVLEAELDELKRKRSFMPPGDYEQELERILVALARLARQIRSRS